MLAELCHFQIPSILVPYPFSMDDHQTYNAKVVAQGGGAFLLREESLSPDRLARGLDILVSRGALRNNMRLALKAMDRPEACGEILQDWKENILR